VQDREQLTITVPIGGNLLQAVERETIRQVLARSGGNITRAARELGIFRQSLVRKMQKLAIASRPVVG